MDGRLASFPGSPLCMCRGAGGGGGGGGSLGTKLWVVVEQPKAIARNVEFVSHE